MRVYYVYILSNKRNGTLYVGITNDLERRVYEHKTGLNEGFTKKYGIKSLMYFEEYANSYDAIEREKQLKAGSRKNKIELIEKDNPLWKDLAMNWYD